jgi:pimeloyl-ACP methyl ester carboxylesterase
LGGLNVLYRDQPVRLPGGKIGIITRPTGDPAEPRRIVLALNTGVIHRVGHGRMYVTLARRLAAQGNTVLRFDLSGIGDSEKRADALSTTDGALADIREVLDWLEAAMPGTPVVLIGLCTGAHLAVLHGGIDPRVEAAVLLDPFIPRTPMFHVNYHVNYYVQRVRRGVLNRSSWSGVGRRLWSVIARRYQGEAEGSLEQIVHQGFEDAPVRAHIEQAYKTAIDRRLTMLMVLTGGMLRYHNYRRQLFDAFPKLRFGDLLKIEYWGATDHVFSHRDDRERLFSRIEAWIEQLDRRPRSQALPHANTKAA